MKQLNLNARSSPCHMVRVSHKGQERRNKKPPDVQGRCHVCVRTVSFFATGELCVSGRNASCLAPSHYLGALSTREVGRRGGGRFKKA